MMTGTVNLQKVRLPTYDVWSKCVKQLFNEFGGLGAEAVSGTLREHHGES